MAFDNRPFFHKFCLKVFHFLHKLIHNAWQIRGEHVDGRPRIVASIWARIVDDRHWADVTRDHLRMVWDMITHKLFNALLRDGGHMAAERAHDVPTLALIIQLQHLGHAPIANALATAAQTAASGLSVTLQIAGGHGAPLETERGPPRAVAFVRRARRRHSEAGAVTLHLLSICF